MKEKKHNWIKNDYDKKPSNFAAENLGSDFHNGPKCKTCGFEFCEHCYPKGWETKCGTKSFGSDDRKLDKSFVGMYKALSKSMLNK